MRRSDLNLEKRVFWVEKRHDREKDLETKYNTTCETHKLHENA